MAGVSVQVSGSGTVANAPVVYVTEKQVGVILPSRTPLGNATATLSYQGRSSNPFPITVVRRSFGIFTLNQGGTGPAVAQNFISDSNQPVNTVLSPARPGQTVTLWGTGLGPVAGDEAGAPQPGDLNPSIRVNVGGRNASIRYAGRSGCCAAVDQIVFDVPDVSGCYVPVVVFGSSLTDISARNIQAEAQQSNFTTIAVSSDGAPCTDPAGLSGAELAKLQQAGTLRVGALAVSRLFPFALGALQENAAASLSRFDPSTFLRSRGIFGFPSLGSCLAYPLNLEETESIDPFLAAPLDAGSALNISGPSGSRQLQRQSTGAYAALLGGAKSGSSALYLNAGSYTVDNGTGGADVGPFRASFSVPQPLKWLNKGSLPRSASTVIFTWSDADPDGFVIMTSFGNNNQVAAYTICTERSDMGAISVPPASIVIVGQGGGFGAFPNNFSLGIARTFRFDAPGLDAGLISVMLMDGFFAP